MGAPAVAAILRRREQDEEVWAAVGRTRRRLVITMLSIIALFSLGVLLGIVKW